MGTHFVKHNSGQLTTIIKPEQGGKGKKIFKNQEPDLPHPIY